MKKLIVGNWKMNGSLAANQSLLDALKLAHPQTTDACGVAVCVPAVYLAQAQALLTGSALQWGAQDVSAHEQGAFTGENSGAMLREFGCRYVLVGHSERRQYHGETDAVVATKAQRALAYGITPIVCVGESLAQRQAGDTMSVVKGQLAAVVHAVGHCITEVVVAYEPVWAIGTGRTASPEQAQEVHQMLRNQLLAACGKASATPKILYGGSMNASNAAALLSQQDIDGGLIGGASLKAQDFMTIVSAAQYQ
jgi:triosephosphate isomerase